MVKPPVCMQPSGPSHDVRAAVTSRFSGLFIKRLRCIQVLSNGAQKLFAMVAEVLLGQRRRGREEGSGECRELIDDLVVMSLDEDAERCGFSGCRHV